MQQLTSMNRTFTVSRVRFDVGSISHKSTRQSEAGVSQHLFDIAAFSRDWPRENIEVPCLHCCP